MQQKLTNATLEELIEKVIQQLEDAGFDTGTIRNYKLFYKRLINWQLRSTKHILMMNLPICLSKTMLM